MSKVHIKTPFFMFNPKSYLYGGSLIDELVSVIHLKKYHSLYSLFYRKNLQL